MTAHSRRVRLASTMIAAVALAGLVTSTAPQAIAAPDVLANSTDAAPAEASTSGDALAAGEQLSGGESIVSADRTISFVFQMDGNAVVYARDGRATWSSGTSAVGGRLVMQTDGNVVVYSRTDVAVWNSGTFSPGSELVMQNDGNLVSYRTDDSASWSIRTGKLSRPDLTEFGYEETLYSGDALRSPDGRFRLVMQTDGNLVVYGPHGATWSTGTSGSGTRLRMQEDGNLVVYSASGRALWASGSWGRYPYLRLQDDGNLVVYSSMTAGPLWNLRAVQPSNTLEVGRHLYPGPGGRLVSVDGRYRAIIQADGNFVIYGPNGAEWSTGTSGPSPYLWVSGISVVVSNEGGTTWAAAAGGGKHDRLVMQNDGNLVLYATSGAAVWSSRTGVLVRLFEFQPIPLR